MKFLLTLIVPIFLFGFYLPVQKIVVNATSYESQKAKMYLYEDERLIREFDAVLGRNGFGMTKKEGDAQTPQGVFSLTQGFGYEDMRLKIDYLKVEEYHYCIDDTKSKLYNRIVESTIDAKDYYSFEYMRRSDDLYQYGVVIDYNKEQIKGAGSCIFLHVKREDDRPTAGCIAVAKEDMKFILHWLDKDKHPRIIQGVNIR